MREERSTRTTINRNPDLPFAQIANVALRDKRLSYRARGILALALSNSGEWEATARYFHENGPEGRDAVQTALNELTALGYRRVVRENTSTGFRTVAVWSHVPDDADFQCTGFPTNGNPVQRETRPSIEDYSSEDYLPEEQELLLPTAVADGRDRFDEFWDVYPRKVGKQAARKAWAKAVKTVGDPQVIIGAAARYAVDPNREPQFTAHPTTWLNRGGWDDEPLPERSGSKSSAEQAADALQRGIQVTKQGGRIF